MEMEAPSERSQSSEPPAKNTRSVLTLITTWSPPIWLEKIVISVTVPILVWVVTYLWVGADGLPGGQIFALLVLLFFGIATGNIPICHFNGYIWHLKKLKNMFS